MPLVPVTKKDVDVAMKKSFEAPLKQIETSLKPMSAGMDSLLKEVGQLKGLVNDLHRKVDKLKKS